jgi:3-isopropylmalate dehydrogenase
MKKILVIHGDGIGRDIVDEAVRILKIVNNKYSLSLEFEEALAGGCAYDDCGNPLPASTLNLALNSDAVLLGAVGGPKWEGLDFSVRPERALLGLRSELQLFANLRPVKVYPLLVDASPLKKEIITGVDIMVLRELTGDIYFGKPRGVEKLPDGSMRGVNTMVYTTGEIKRIAKIGFELAGKRRGTLTSVDKANVLETTELWRNVVTLMHKDFPNVKLNHMYVDNCAMQLILNPKQFDVIVTSNLFGDILSDEAAIITGSIGMLPSASLGEKQGMYEPIHGSAPDIAGKNIANPIATILSAAMMLRHSLNAFEAADDIENAVNLSLQRGFRTKDIHTQGTQLVGTKEMGNIIREIILE